MSELDFAAATREAPRLLRNSYYVPLRVSGTGIAYRPSIDEYVYRDPAIWLSPDIQRRVLGLPIVIEHPAGKLITSQFFGERCVGMLVTSFIQDGELWGTARIIDAYACELIAQGVFDTSPAILLPDGERVCASVGDITVLVEGVPEFIDHIALIYTGDGNKGVWTRSNGPGVAKGEAA